MGRLVAQVIPFRLGRHADVLGRFFRLPVTECLGFEVVQIRGPVPRHVDDLEHRTVFVPAVILDPINRVFRLRILNPMPTFIVPIAAGAISTSLDEF